ncbi:hypothetical protein PQ478_08950 [Alkalihalophilus pseudofirmus]|uniref:hypothetical protein n=1 Tax=Alkalihalophilus pseudofirmus TaxID=79885 RepID=UPI00259BDF1A|nr:hypothetical protein [Alkalihalophilus pseudofirmus]WEG18598.1 hypothetical protein PQ478_08950 [Alkalihalophilus pseudofirmus]
MFKVDIEVNGSTYIFNVGNVKYTVAASNIMEAKKMFLKFTEDQVDLEIHNMISKYVELKSVLSESE